MSRLVELEREIKKLMDQGRFNEALPLARRCFDEHMITPRSINIRSLLGKVQQSKEKMTELLREVDKDDASSMYIMGLIKFGQIV